MLLALLPLLAACTAEPEEPGFALAERKPLSFQTYQGRAIYDGDDPNSRFSRHLLPGELAFEPAREGQLVPLNTVIVMPSLEQDEEALLRIEFDRSDLGQDFIRGFFYGDGPDFLRSHPFGELGIEPVLTDSRLILLLHAGVLLHLRDGLEDWPIFRTFASKQALGRIAAVSGEVYLSSEPDWARIKLGHFYASALASLSADHPATSTIELEDGSLMVSAPPEAYRYPRRYVPRVMEGFR